MKHTLTIGLLGVPFDGGVIANHGRSGAMKGPDAVRMALKTYGACEIADFGDVSVVPWNILETHARVTKAVSDMLNQNVLPIVLGGGHDISFANIRALAHSTRGNIGGINVDAHLDVREVKNGVITSGTPFRMALTELDGLFEGIRFTEIGIDPLVNSKEHMDYAVKNGITVVTVEAFRQSYESVLTRAFSMMGDNGFLSIDIDSIQHAFAPGCSAPAPFGLYPEEVRRIAFEGGKSHAVKIMDIMEVNPAYDVDGRTARLAAALVRSFCDGYTERSYVQAIVS